MHIIIPGLVNWDLLTCYFTYLNPYMYALDYFFFRLFKRNMSFSQSEVTDTFVGNDIHVSVEKVAKYR